MRATELAALLHLEKSSVSRMVRKLIGGGLLREDTGAGARSKLLSLTARGNRLLAGIDAFARTQVSAALKQLTQAQTATVVEGLGLYAQALAGEAPRNHTPVSIDSGYAVSVFARCVEMRATQDGRIKGAIAIDGEDLGENLAHLRWFIVDDGLRGLGVGRKLLSAALAFCDRRKFAATHLWTFRGLDTARRLYEAHGFTLAEERPGDQWGKRVMEQHFIRPRP